jgi:S-adenosylmethionine uptake transporter
MALGMAGFTLNDSVMKSVGADLDLFQAIFVRGVFATILIGLLAWRAGAFYSRPDKRDRGLIALRSVAELGATFCFLTALINMPMANVTAILQTLPLTVALAAFFVYGERFRWHRGVAILVGLVGVLFIVRPGTEGFNNYSLLALVAVLFVTLRDMTARNLSLGVSSLLVAFVTSLVITSAAGLVSVWLNRWTALSAGQAGYLALAAVFIFVGYYCAIAAMRVGDVSFVSPFRYTAMIWAILLGWLVFGDIPGGWTSLGMAVIAGAGLYTWTRERKVAAEG